MTYPFFTDEFGIGQDKVAKIRLDMAERDMRAAMLEAFSPCYENDEWRAMRRRQFDTALREYRRAQHILDLTNAGVDFEVAA